MTWKPFFVLNESNRFEWQLMPLEPGGEVGAEIFFSHDRSSLFVRIAFKLLMISMVN